MSKDIEYWVNYYRLQELKDEKNKLKRNKKKER